MWPDVINDFIDPNGSAQQFIFKILREYKTEINKILIIALEKSPDKKIWFLTASQFGPENGNVEIIYTIGDFWALHDSVGLTFNTMYEMYGK